MDEPHLEAQLIIEVEISLEVDRVKGICRGSGEVRVAGWDGEVTANLDLISWHVCRLGVRCSYGREHHRRDSDHVSNLVLHFMFSLCKKTAAT